MQFKSILAIIFVSSALANPLNLERRTTALANGVNQATNSQSILVRRFVESVEAADAVDTFIGTSILNILGLKVDLNGLGQNPYYPTFRNHLLEIELDLGLNNLLNGILGGLQNRRTYNRELCVDDVYRILKDFGCNNERLMHHSRTLLGDILHLNIGGLVNLNI